MSSINVECISCGNIIKIRDSIGRIGSKSVITCSISGSDHLETLHWCGLCWKERFLHPSERTRNKSNVVNKIMVV